MNPMHPLTICQTLAFATENAANARAWAKHKDGQERPAEILDAFEQGVKQGYGDAIRDMRSHGYKFKID